MKGWFKEMLKEAVMNAVYTLCIFVFLYSIDVVKDSNDVGKIIIFVGSMLVIRVLHKSIIDAR